MPVARSLWLGRLVISAGMQARKDAYCDSPWMGFAYGSWIPKLRITRGPRYVPALTGYWLCFHFSVDLYPKSWGNRGVHFR